jgi:hypothetical protein
VPPPPVSPVTHPTRIGSQPNDRNRYETGSVGGDDDGSSLVLVALEEASQSVDRAINATVARLFSGQRADNVSTPAELLRVFRYPAQSNRDLARAAEVSLPYVFRVILSQQ